MRARAANQFGYWLDVSMANANMTGQELAERIGVHSSAVSRWRAGKSAPAMEALGKLAEVFNVEPLRLAVTAGLVSSKVAGVPPVDMPEPLARREKAREYLANNPYLTDDERREALEWYDSRVKDRT